MTTIGLVHGCAVVAPWAAGECEVAAGQLVPHLQVLLGEVLAVRVQDAGAKLVVFLQFGVGVGELAQASRG